MRPGIGLVAVHERQQHALDQDPKAGDEQDEQTNAGR
jgi:hypothetical protein